MVVVGYIFGIVILFLCGAFIINSIKSLIEKFRALSRKKKSPEQVSNDDTREKCDTDDRKGGASE